MSGVWCVRSQGGGGSPRGASATDDNAASGRARAREPGKIRKRRPRGPCGRFGTVRRGGRRAHFRSSGGRAGKHPP
ncbi:hypothetical protein B7R87_11685 [Streptomyces tsukubensis]|uniref:Uncharacterized protein n=1 Tax=Streptomyces tsukubensis (strain DSM 42081 / NBRC 108919 / NRRL 18488 / 9993) TaxID=1114943 RepID=A0A7G3UGK1_STRT9|nr:hypothetical protein B7R87_11685 [Streptomyces tsukubensis]QKM69466.1 hypothetical protein STSU_022090 [Streptomyces tsukubensis NRRL18488]TAI42604.1 hypothetical protein EWI31_19440 [Streptomyces tsukubensis]